MAARNAAVDGSRRAAIFSLHQTRTIAASPFTITLLDSTMRDGGNTVEPFVVERVDGEVRLFRPGGQAGRAPASRFRRQRQPDSQSGS